MLLDQVDQYIYSKKSYFITNESANINLKSVFKSTPVSTQCSCVGFTACHVSLQVFIKVKEKKQTLKP